MSLFLCGAIGLAQDSPTLERYRPILLPSGKWQSAPHGNGNIYAPEVLFDNGIYRMWFGGQGKDGHDRIQLAESVDGKKWVTKGVVLEDKKANHVNDPTVVKVDGTYWMYYTRADKDIRDDIAVAISNDGIKWSQKGVVLRPTSAGKWDSLLVGRPSVLYENGLFRMWYDGRKDLPLGAPAEDVPKSSTSVRSVGYAESNNGIDWTRPQEVPVFGEDAGGVHVVRIAQHYVMVYESRDGTRMATSSNGLNWNSQRLWIDRSSTTDDAYGHVTPFLFIDPTEKSSKLFVGGARSSTWDQNIILGISITDQQWALVKMP